MRHLPEGVAATEAALADGGFSALPFPGKFAATDPWLVWQSPTSSLLIATRDDAPDALLGALRPGLNALACSIDATAGSIAFELNGSRASLDQLLSRLTDGRALLLTGRSLGRALAHWLNARLPPDDR